jgi:hypothetical protein
LEIQIQKVKSKEVVVAVGDQELTIHSKPVREILVEREKRIIAEKQLTAPPPPPPPPEIPAKSAPMGPSIEKPSVKISIAPRIKPENIPTVSGPNRKRAVVTVTRDPQAL